MPERTSYTPGTPSWVDIGTDVEGAKAFYQPLFGWEAAEAGPVEETGGYGFFLKGEKMVAGYGPQQNPGPPVWSSYVSVDDAGKIAELVEANGGSVVMPPMAVMDAGSMAVFQDPTGAFFSVWQPGQHIGAQLVNEHGALSWNELNTRDLSASKAFYTEVFGWGVNESEHYTEFTLDGQSIAGMMNMPDAVPDQVPNNWLVYFWSDDVDATAAKARELGGQAMDPFDIPGGGGRIAILTDPQGATFAVAKMTQHG